MAKKIKLIDFYNLKISKNSPLKYDGRTPKMNFTVLKLEVKYQTLKDTNYCVIKTEFMSLSSALFHVHNQCILIVSPTLK